MENIADSAQFAEVTLIDPIPLRWVSHKSGYVEWIYSVLGN